MSNKHHLGYEQEESTDLDFQISEFDTETTVHINKKQKTEVYEEIAHELFPESSSSSVSKPVSSNLGPRTIMIAIDDTSKH